MRLVKRPMLIGGIICCTASVFAFYFEALIPLFAVLATAVILVCVLFLGADKRLVAVLISVLLVLFLAMSFYKKEEQAERFIGREITAELTFCGDEASYGSVYTSVVRVKSDTGLPDNIKLELVGFTEGGYRQGDRISAVIKIEKLSEKYRASSYAENIFAQCELVSKERDLSPQRLGSMISRLKEYITDTLSQGLSADSFATVLALLTGDNRYFSDSFYSAVKGAGVSHVMVVSGLHLSIIMGAVYSLLSVFGKNRFVRSVVSLLTVLFVSAVCGFTMSILRAGVMFAVSAVAPIVERDNDTLNTLGTAVVLISVHSPFAVFSVAFQLSLLSTFGILVLSPELSRIITERFKITNRPLKALVDMLCVTLSANFMTLPVVIYRFGYVSYTAPAANILITHAVSYAMVIAIIGLIVGAVPFLEVISEWIFILCELVVKYINAVIRLFGTGPTVITVGRWSVMPSVFLILLALFLIHTCKRRENLLKLKKQ